MPTLVTRDQYFDAALEILAAEGFGNLRIGRLCGAIGVTSGSFYHYFGSWKGFVSALLHHWEADQLTHVGALLVEPAEPAERISRLTAVILAIPHGAEASIRAWGNADQTVGLIQRRVDERRREAILDIIGGVVRDRAKAQTLAMMGVSILIGFQQLRSPVDTNEMRRVLDEFSRAVLSRAPEHRAVTS